MILAPQFGYEAFVKTKNVSLSKLQLTLWFSLPLTDTIILFHTIYRIHIEAFDYIVLISSNKLLQPEVCMYFLK